MNTTLKQEMYSHFSAQTMAQTITPKSKQHTYANRNKLFDVSVCIEARILGVGYQEPSVSRSSLRGNNKLIALKAWRIPHVWRPVMNLARARGRMRMLAMSGSQHFLPAKSCTIENRNWIGRCRGLSSSLATRGCLGRNSCNPYCTSVQTQ